MEYFTLYAKKAINMAADIAVSYNHRYVGTEHLLLALMKVKGVSSAVIAKYMNQEDFEALMATFSGDEPLDEGTQVSYGFSVKAKHVLEVAKITAERHGIKQVGTSHLFLAILLETDCIAVRILSTLGISLQKMYADTLVECGFSENDVKKEMSSLKKSGGKTPYLEQFTKDLTKLASEGKLDPVIGREDEITRVIQVLCRRTKNNPCLVGEPGVGKTAIAEGLASLIADGIAPDYIKNVRILVLDLSGMIAGSKYRGEFEERIKKLMDEVKQNPNIVLFLDEIHTIIGAGSAEGTMDAANILKPALSRGEIRIIGATTRDEYRKYIEKDAALERRFQPISVEEPDEQTSVAIMRGLKPRFESFHKLTIDDDVCDSVVKMTARYVSDRFLPDKAIDCLDEACSKAKLRGFSINPELTLLEKKLDEITEEKESLIGHDSDSELIADLKVREHETLKEIEKFKSSKNKKKIKVSTEDVANIICSWTGIPVSRVSDNEYDRLLKLEKTLHSRVIGQNEAIVSVSKAIRRGRIGLKDPNRPIGSFLFLGPTGVGKTELSKALAESVFGRESSIIRVDMSEYMEKHSVAKMIGSPPGYVGHDEGGKLSDQVRQKPYSIVLFDEIEKANPDVFNVLLQVLDEGHLTDSQGRRVSFKNTIIIMTSNAGAQSIINPKKLGFNKGDDASADYERMKQGVMEEVKKIFRPEFINRIDDIIVFHELTDSELQEIVKLMLKSFKKRLLDGYGVKLSVPSSVVDFIAKKGNDPKYGARPIRRAIQDYIEDPIANELLSGYLTAGDTAKLKIKDDKVIVTK